ncbi:bifunctional serine/threonine-protein kinase/formylglycine-generating enzyme family protein [Polycyclovorans algicola]|uniref:bifunctional serine/threonine-protein kinase/formylglycine-generating enzyme family protein n=1 Tax=Polycyclovorans algicola TaxID=616992 RepID=UPI0006946FD5|nr:bifunctional serine/threonine-protein kinase/formylglycine-generating enzyme family protein [Polycyclovorans algicola]
MCAICGYDESRPRSAMFLRHGTLLADRYRIGRVLGRPGGFGITYLAWDVHLQQRVAIKEYLPRELANRDTDRLTVSVHTTDERGTFEAGREQFLREARIVAGLDHPNIVRVLSYFNAHGTAYLVMDYYEGLSMGDYLATVSSVLDPVVAVGIIEPVLEGLAFVHQHGVVHRDIKPHNLYLAAIGKPILLDFGAARRSSGEGARSISVVLTEGYAPLEQYQRRTAQGPWTDVYGLAATLFRMTTGHAPPLALDRLDSDPLDSADWGNVPAALRDVLTRALAVQPEDRYASAEAFLEALRAWRHATPAPGEVGEVPPALWRRAPDSDAGPPGAEPVDRPSFNGGGGNLLPWLAAVALAAVAIGWTAVTLETPPTPGDPALGGSPASQAPASIATGTPRTTPQAPVPTIGRDALVALPMASMPAQSVTVGGTDGVPVSVLPLATFEISRFEVTVEAFAQFVADQRYRPEAWANFPCDGVTRGDWSSPHVARTERVPVVCVSLHDAQAYAAWRSRVSGDDYRLPTEAEWEAAARAGTRSAYWWGDDLESDRANCAGCRPFTTRAANVGRYPANRLGLHDTAGNVREWTCSSVEMTAAVSPLCASVEGAAAAQSFVVRGGSWHQGPDALRSSARDLLPSLRRDHHTGFRLVRQPRSN